MQFLHWAIAELPAYCSSIEFIQINGQCGTIIYSQYELQIKLRTYIAGAATVAIGNLLLLWLGVMLPGLNIVPDAHRARWTDSIL